MNSARRRRGTASPSVSRRLWERGVDNWRAEEARNQTRFRAANEAIETVSDADGHRARETYICECSDVNCTAPIALSRAEYESVRSVATHFAIAPNHENPEIDQVVTEYENYSCIANLPGEPSRIARETDPREKG